MNRYQQTSTGSPQAAAGWQLTQLTPPSALFGANGMKFGPDGKLYVVQAFGSQISAIDTVSGACQTVSPVGGAIVAPDDLTFDSHGVMYITEVMNERVAARTPDGQVRILTGDVPAANGITTYQDRIFMDECRPGGRVFELYPDGRAPRIIADDLPLPNALSVGPDERLYFPEIAAGEIWRVALEGGRPERFLAGLAIPTAVKFDRKGQLVTTQAGSGEILRVDIQSGAKTRVTQVRPGIDNFAVSDDNRIFISHFTDGGVAEILSDGRERILVPAGFLGPWGLTVANDGALYAADGGSLVTISADGKPKRLAMLFDQGFPHFIRGLTSCRAGGFYATNTAGNVALYNPSARESQMLAADLNELFGLAEAPDGDVIVAEGGAGRLLKINAKGEVSVLAHGLARPMDVAIAADGSCYVSESGKGRVVQVNGSVTTVIDGLQTPQGLAVAGDQLLVLDSGKKELLALSLKTKQRQTMATNLPIGAQPGVTPKPLLGIPGLIPGPLSPFAGLAVGSDGTIYIAGDGEGSILALKRVA